MISAFREEDFQSLHTKQYKENNKENKPHNVKAMFSDQLRWLKQHS